MVLTTNIWKEAGLTNGAKGTVKHIIYEPNAKPPKSLPVCVIVSFEQYKGPWYKGLENCYPIIPINFPWMEGSATVSRTMLPLSMGYAISIHNSQGRSMDNLIVNIGSNEFANGLTYTALSRIRKFENLFFEPVLCPNNTLPTMNQRHHRPVPSVKRNVAYSNKLKRAS